MKKRVVLVTIAMNNMAGGLERNIVRVANYLAGQNHDVHIVTFDTPAAQAFYPIAPNVTWHRVGENPPHRKIGFLERLRLIGRVRDVIRPAARDRTYVIAFHHGILARLLLASAFLRTKLICSERNALTIYDHITAPKWNLNFALLAFTSAITVQFKGYIKDYPKYLQSRIHWIPNVVEPASCFSAPDQKNPQARYTLLAVGRLSAQKNYNHLINVFARLAPEFPDWDLRIVGEGEFRSKLTVQIAELNMGQRITMPGTSQDMPAQYASAHLFAMPSKWEGFPNALAEALAHGLPAVGFDGCAGVRDLILNGKNGLLAAGMADEETLGASLRTLMANPALRREMGQAAVKSVAPYAPEQVLVQWQGLLD